ncbi:MAG: CPBP family intramembrane glutamic endopeptidase [Cytophagales bacterium]|nr:CPBP family intramembrane glutamic endopeptidase [Cytophagales bacterium]
MSSSNVNLGGGIAVAFGFLLLLLLPFEAFFRAFDFPSFQSEQLGDIMKNLIIMIGAFVLIYRSGYQKLAGLTTLKTKITFLIIVPLYFLLAGPFQYWILDYQFDSIQIGDIFILLLAMLSVGFSEELVFRGYVLPHLLIGADARQRLIIPIFTAGFLFGVLHFVNLLSPDANIITVCAQVTYATMFGIAFGILLLRTERIFPIGCLHGLINFSGNLHDLPGAIEPGNIDEYRVWEAVLSIIIVIPFFILALRQLPKIQREHLLQQYK